MNNGARPVTCQNTGAYKRKDKQKSVRRPLLVRDMSLNKLKKPHDQPKIELPIEKHPRRSVDVEYDGGLHHPSLHAISPPPDTLP